MTMEMAGYNAEPTVRELSGRERLDFWRYVIGTWWCALRGGHIGNWDCGDCFDRWNVGMSCGHENLWRECSRCGEMQFVRDGLPHEWGRL